MRKTIIYLAAISMLVLAAVPVYAGAKDTAKSYGFQAETDVGFVGAGSDYRWGNDILLAVWRGPTWFRCISYGADEDMLPSIQKKGNDTVIVSGSYVPEDFDFCWGHPEQNDLSFSFEIVADEVVISQSIDKFKQTVIKGDDYGFQHFISSHTLSAYEGTASGVMFGSPINSTLWAGFEYDTSVFD